jgi:hypothetical protein
MTGIPHFEDLSARAILQCLDEEWHITEKLDGSYLCFGLDDQGQFFSQRKGGKPCYSVDQWPNEYWAGTYKLAHSLASILVCELVEQKLLSNDQFFGAEIIHGRMPNTIPYKYDQHLDGQLIITGANFDMSHISAMLNKFRATWCQDTAFLDTSHVLAYRNQEQNWSIGMLTKEANNHVSGRYLEAQKAHLKTVLTCWLSNPSGVEGFSVLEVLESSLNRRHPNCGDRLWSEVRDLLSTERQRLRLALNSLMLLFKSNLLKFLVNDIPSSISTGLMFLGGREGVVVRASTVAFKITDRDNFARANHFTHMVRYWIVGGRRPARPSFLSRTQHWSPEDRIKRLEKLRQRYLTSRPLHRTVFLNGRTFNYDYQGQLHERTLGMFADTIQRIKDGR